MAITVHDIAKAVDELLKEAVTVDNGTLDTLMDTLDMDHFMGMVNERTADMTSTIAEEISTATGVPALAVAGQAHGMALAHLAIFMFAAGQRLKTAEFAAADVSEEDVDAAIASILGGSNG
jgi:hypothetical protein